MKQELTFKPNLGATENNPDLQGIGSRLKIQEGGIEEFLKASKLEYDRRLKMGDEQRRIKEEQELAECTYKPNTIELP